MHIKKIFLSVLMKASNSESFQNKKICFVVISIDFFLSHRLDLAANLATTHEVHLITNTDNASKSQIQKITNSGIVLCHLAGRKGSLNILGYLRYLFLLRKQIKILKLDYVFYVTLEMSVLGALINNTLSLRKSFFLITGLEPFFFDKKLKYIILRFLQKIIFTILRFKKNYQFIFQNNDDLQIFKDNNLIQNGYAQIIQGNGIDTDYFAYHKREERSEIIFLFASKLIYSKGIMEFIKASEYLSGKYYDAQFHIAGLYDSTNPNSISKNELKMIQTNDSIFFRGFVEHNKMKDCFYESSVFVLPSYGEGLPKVALEAASTGMPLIVSDTRGARDCVIEGKNGFYTKINDTDDLKNVMEKFILERERLGTFGKFSSSLVAQKFSLPIITNKFLMLLEC